MAGDEGDLAMALRELDEDPFLFLREVLFVAAEHRTIAGQVEFWAKVGRAALDNPDLPVSFIAESLVSLAEPREQVTPFVPRSRKA